MGAKNEGEALDYIPPAGLGTGLPNAAKSVAVGSGASTAVQATGAPAGVIGTFGTYITFFYVQTAASGAPVDIMHIRFGEATVGDAAVTDMPFPAGQYVSWWCGPGMSHFKAISTATSAGILYWWKSNQ